MRLLPSNRGLSMLFPLLAAACAGDNFTPAGAAGGGGTGAGTTGGGATSVGGAAGAGADTSTAKGGSSAAGAGSQASSGTGGSATSGDSGAGGTGDGQGGTDTGAGGDDAGGSSSSGGAGAGAGAGGTAAGMGGTGSGKGGASGGASGSGGKAGSTALGGAGGKAGVGGSGGSGGVAGAGAGGLSGAAGAGGAVGVPCNGSSSTCGDGSYCDTDDNVCRSCGDLDRLSFGNRQVKRDKSAGLGALRFPRPGSVGGNDRLLFRTGDVGNVRTAEIYSAVVDASGNLQTPTNVGCCTNKGHAEDSGPLLLPPGMNGTAFSISGLDAPEARFLLIDSGRSFNGGGLAVADHVGRNIFLARWNANDYFPIQRLNIGLENYSAALSVGAAPDARRFYWMSRATQGATPVLKTMLLSPNTSPAQNVEVRIPNCDDPVVMEDFEPFLSSNGDALVFTARCKEGDRTRLYIATPAVDGTLPAPKPLTGASATDPDEGSGWLSPNKCELWFVRDGNITAATRN